MDKKIRHNLSDSPKLHGTIDNIIKDLCQKHSTENLEKDIIALFEDIIQFFSGREDDFIDFDSISMDQKEEIYNEIMTIINLLRKLGKSVDRKEALKIMSQNLLVSLSKKNRHHLLTTDEELPTIERDRLKKEFSIITIQNLYKERQEKILKSPKSLESTIQNLKNNVGKQRGNSSQERSKSF